MRPPVRPLLRAHVSSDADAPLLHSIPIIHWRCSGLARTHAHMHTCSCARTHARTHASVHARTHAHMLVCTHARTSTHTHIAHRPHAAVATRKAHGFGQHPFEGAHVFRTALRAMQALPSHHSHPRRFWLTCATSAPGLDPLTAASSPGLGPPTAASSPGPGLGPPMPHLGRGRDWAPPAVTSAPGLGSPQPHLHRDWARPCLICAGTGLTPATSAPELGHVLRCVLRFIVHAALSLAACRFVALSGTRGC